VDERPVPFPPPRHPLAPPPPLAETEVERLFDLATPVKISVVLPATNESVLLERTVVQFRATLPEPSEIIVVDNGSRDGCSDFLLDDPPADVRLIRTPEPLGVAGARNRGLAAARGEVLVFADAHVDLPERWWQPLVVTLGQPQVGVVGPAMGVMGRPEHHYGYGQRILVPSLTVKWLRDNRPDPHPVPTLGGGFMALRRTTLTTFGAFDDGLVQWGYEDLELCLRYWLLGLEAWVVPSVAVHHYFRPDGANGVDLATLTHNQLRVGCLHLDEDLLADFLATTQRLPGFASAMARIVQGDVPARRAEYFSRRVRTPRWLFERFTGLDGVPA
jgi:glycosyltransferase involved in cell wall biosynthesis